MKRDDVDDDRDEGTVRESLAELQQELTADELGSTTVQPLASKAPAARRPTPMPPSLSRRSSAFRTPPPVAPVVPNTATPPYGAMIPAAAPVALNPSGFDQTVLGTGGADLAKDPDLGMDPIEGATQVAAASYDLHAAQAMMFVNTPLPRPYAQQPAGYVPPVYEANPGYPPQPPFTPDGTPLNAMPLRPSSPMPLGRPGMRPSTPFPVTAAEPMQPADNPDLAQRLARLQALSLERPATGAPRTPSSSSGFGTKLPWILLALVVVGGGIYHVRTLRNAEKATAATPAVGTDTTKSTATQPRAGSLLASGYIAAKSPITLSATTSGRLQEVTVAAGDTITKGQLLARIGDGNIRAELSLAAARVRDASRQHQRTAMLVKAQAATPADLERAVGAVEVARAEMRVIEQKLEDTRIRSPINGTVLELLARPGESLTMGQNQAAGILRLADLSALVAEVDIAEGELKNVQMGQEAEITTESQRTRAYRGVVREIAEQADRARGTVLVKVDILPDLPEGAQGAGSGAAGSADAGSAVEATPAPAAKGRNAKKTDKKAEKKDDKKDAPKDPVVVAKPPVTTLRPGMAVQVRFLAKE